MPTATRFPMPVLTLFVTLAWCMAVGPWFVCPERARAEAPEAERIFHGGPIVTVNTSQPTAAAVAVAGGKFVAVGDEAEVMRLKGPKTEVVDLAGRTLVPGFIDGHSHFFSSVDVQVQALCASPPAGPCTSVADVITQLKKLAERRRIGAGEFVIGFGYDPDLLAERRPPTKQELDAAFPDNPVFVIHVSGHGAMLNSKALTRFGITAATPTPSGGVIGREPGSQEPSGLLFETAFLPIFSQLPSPPPDEQIALLASGQKLYMEAGITTAQEGATTKQQLDLLRRAADRGLLEIDVVSLALFTEMDEIFAGRPPVTEKEYRNRLRIGGVKVLSDGSPQGKTAYFTALYRTGGPAGQQNWRGEPTMPQPVLNEKIGRAHV